MRKVYQELASLVVARNNCIAEGNTNGKRNHSARITDIIDNYFPSSGGIAKGVAIDLDKSNGSKLVFTFSYHHMNDAGSYDGWTEYVLTITATFHGINLSISGPDRNNIKEYLYAMFGYRLEQELRI